MPFACPVGTAAKSGRTLRRLWVAAASLWIGCFSVVLYQAYREPYDLWLMLDPTDAKYKECWVNAPLTASIAQQPAGRNLGSGHDQLSFETPQQEAARIRQVAYCYRSINRIRQMITWHGVLK
jgi:hypothetical protein